MGLLTFQGVRSSYQQMIRRAYIIGIMALGLTASAALTSPAVGRFVSSAHSFRRHFRELKNSGSSLSPLERIVFSLILIDRGCTQASGQPVVQDPRT